MSVSSSHIYILEVGARRSTVAPHAYFCWYIGSHWWWRAVARLVVPPTPARLLLWHLPMLSQVYKNVSLSYKPPIWPRLATLKDRHRVSFVFMGSGLPVCLLMSTSFLFPILHVCLSSPPNGLILHTFLTSLFPQSQIWELLIWLMDSHQALTKCWRRLYFHLEAQPKEGLLAVVGRIRFITGCGTGGLISLLAVGQCFLSHLPHEFLHSEVHVMAAGFHWSKHERESEGRQDRSRFTLQHNLRSDFPSLLFYLFVEGYN